MSNAIVIGGSAGSFPAVSAILEKIPVDYPFPIILIMHRLKHVRHGFVEALQLKTTKTVMEPEDKQPIKKAFIYVAPANYHLYIEKNLTFSLSTEEAKYNSRPSIDVGFQSAANTFKSGLTGILLSGANNDGASGLRKIKEFDGTTIIQDFRECTIDTMPRAADKLFKVDFKFTSEQIANHLLSLPESCQ